MMVKHSTRKAAGPHRRWVFRIWVGLTVFLAGFLAVAIPFADYFADRYRFIAAVVPLVEVFLLIIGFGWLVWFVTARGRRGRARRRKRRNEGGEA